MFEKAETERQIRPIQFWFILDPTLERAASDAIQQQWLGIPLPTRRSFEEGTESVFGLDIETGQITSHEVLDPIVIEVNDAIRTLESFGRDELAVELNSQYGAINLNVILALKEGRVILNYDAEKQFPEIKNFDAQLDID